LEEGAPPIDGEQLRAFARQHLVAYQVPKEVRVVEKLPRTASMKVSEAGVRALFQMDPTADAVAVDQARNSDD
jgi:long-chain acyl-CoA synthetase